MDKETLVLVATMSEVNTDIARYIFRVIDTSNGVPIEHTRSVKEAENDLCIRLERLASALRHTGEQRDRALRAITTGSHDVALPAGA